MATFYTIQDVADMFTGLMEASGASAKVFEFIDREPKIRNDGREAPEDILGKVEFKNVTFAYPTAPNINVLKVLNQRQ